MIERREEHFSTQHQDLTVQGFSGAAQIGSGMSGYSLVGPSADLSLRVSAACLTLLLTADPDSGEQLAVFERVVRQVPGGEPLNQLQPVGGSVTILDLAALEQTCGRFNFDSQSSLQQRDLRIFIEPASWPSWRERIGREFELGTEGLIETSPLREIQEEVGDRIGMTLRQDQLSLSYRKCVFQDRAARSARAGAYETVRIFSVYEAIVQDQELAKALLDQCRATSLAEQIEQVKKGSITKSVSLAVVPLAQVIDAIAEIDVPERQQRIQQGENVFADNVYATVQHLIH